jgi:hypothetical protein
MRDGIVDKSVYARYCNDIILIADWQMRVKRVSDVPWPKHQGKGQQLPLLNGP